MQSMEEYDYRDVFSIFHECLYNKITFFNFSNENASFGHADSIDKCYPKCIKPISGVIL